MSAKYHQEIHNCLLHTVVSYFFCSKGFESIISNLYKSFALECIVASFFLFVIDLEIVIDFSKLLDKKWKKKTELVIISKN